MGIKKLSDGTFEVSYSKRHPVTRKSINNRRKTIIKGGVKQPIKTKADARRVLNELVVQVHEKCKEKLIPRWCDLLVEFLDYFYVHSTSKKSYLNYKLCLEAHTLNLWGRRFSDTITSREIREYIDSINRSESQKQNILKYIRAVFIFAVDNQILSKNPVPKMTFRKNEKLSPVLTEKEASLLLERAKAMKSEWYEIWACALYTGCRNGELYAITWDKVNFDKRLIKIDCAWDKVNGFKDHTKAWYDRYVEIAPPLLHILKELKLKSADSHFVLPRIDDWDRGDQAKVLKTFLEGMGIQQITFHRLRATWATILISKGIAPILVMKMGGWKDLKTMQYYIGLSGVDIKGMTDSYILHDPTEVTAKVLKF